MTARNENANLGPGPGNPPEYWDDYEAEQALEDAAAQYVREHADWMHDAVDIAPFVRRIDSVVWNSDMPLEDKNLSLAIIAREILDAHVAAAIPMVRP